MRLQSYLNEGITPEFEDIEQWLIDNDYGNEIDNVIKSIRTIKKECGDIFNLYSNLEIPFFRGLSYHHDNTSDMNKIYPRTDRYPKTTNIEVHNILDEILYKKFGWKPRSEGVFCISNFKACVYYGRPYIIFPKNGFKFIVSKTTADSFDYISGGDIASIYRGEFGGEKFTKPEGEDLIKVIKWIEENEIQYTDDNQSLKNGLIRGAECIFKCDYYYALDVSKGTLYHRLFNELYDWSLLGDRKP